MSVLSISIGELMSWTQVILSATGAAFFWYIVSSILAWYKLRHVPGPLLASFSYLWTFWAIYSGRSNEIISEAQKKYGKVTRVAPDAVTIFDPETLFRINSARSHYTRSRWYESGRFDHRGDSVLTMLDTPSHDKRKARLAPAFSGRNVAVLETKLDKWLAAFVQLDLITDLSMGKPWGNLKADKDHFGYLEMNKVTTPSLQTWLYLPSARKIFMSSWFLSLFAPRPTDTKGLGLFLGVLDNAVKTRLSGVTEKSNDDHDILDIWIEHGHPADQCVRDLAILVPAGSETSVMMMRGTLLLLMSTPVAYLKLKQEIKDAISNGHISTPVTNEEAKRLEYAHAVVHEGFRVMTPVNFGFPKRVPESGDIICGVPIPGGTEVFVNYHSLMRNEEVFGEDPDSFRPERFLGGGPEVAYRLKVLDFAFGGGHFTCLGRALAIVEMNKIFIELFRYFDFQIAKPEKPWSREVYTTWIVHDFWAKVTEDTMVSATGS